MTFRRADEVERPSLERFATVALVELVTIDLGGLVAAELGGLVRLVAVCGAHGPDCNTASPSKGFAVVVFGRSGHGFDGALPLTTFASIEESSSLTFATALAN
jgi:hypothetical protein